MGGSVFICDNNRIMFSVMGSQVFKHFKTLSFDLRACFIFQKFDKQLRCSVFTFVQYIIMCLNFQSLAYKFYSIQIKAGLMIFHPISIHASKSRKIHGKLVTLQQLMFHF